MKRPVSRTLFAAVSLFCAISLAHAGNAPSPQAAWYAAYLKNSRLIPLPGGRKLNLYCIGAGSPTVWLESGIGGDAYDWRSVQDKIANEARVCAYDRAGLGKSPPAPLPRDTRAEVADLEALLKAANLRGPYVLVGHSMGSYNVRLFADRHLKDVAAMVLVDPAVEDQLPVMERAAPAGAAGVGKSLALAKQCVMPNPSAETLKDCTKAAPESFPPDLAAAWSRNHGAASAQTFGSEVESFLNMDSPEVAAERRSFGSIPLVILTRGERSTDMPKDQAEAEWIAWNGLHDNLAKLSTRGVNRAVAGANHYIQLDKPDAVVDAVREVLTAARQKPDSHR